MHSPYSPIGLITTPVVFTGVSERLPSVSNLPPHTCHQILFVEDNELDVRLFREWLDAAETEYEIDQVGDLESAIACLSNSHSYDLVVADLSLPDSFGLDTIRKILAQNASIPVVVLSDTHDRSLALQAVSEGAEDYLVKGRIDDYWLDRSLRYAIERRRMRARMLIADETLRDRAESHRVARTIQQRFFPKQAPKLPGFDLAGKCFPADETGGDFFDFMPIKNGKLGIVIGDVGGHGIGPAIIMACMRSYLRALLLEYDDVSEVLRLANDLISVDTAQERLVSLFFAELDVENKQLTYCSGGHPVHLLRANGETELLESTSIPLGIQDDVTFPSSREIQLHRGDMLAFYTDGIFECRSPTGEQWGVDTFLNTVRANSKLSCAEIVDRIHQTQHNYTQSKKQADDITLVFGKVE